MVFCNHSSMLNFGLYTVLLSLISSLPHQCVLALSHNIATPLRHHRPFQLQRMDHIVLNYFQEKEESMMEFYTQVLGCTIDSPEDIGRMNGRLTHLRAGPTTMIDLLKRDYEKQEDVEDDSASAGASSSLPMPSAVDHFCLRIDPYNQEELEDYLTAKGIEIQSSGMRKGAEGVGPSIYIQDPEGNTIELKGPAVKPTKDVATNQEDAVVPIETSEPIASATSQSEDSKNNNNNNNNDDDDGGDILKVPVTPCTRICRYNADFFEGQVCIGCYREAYEIGTWASMTPSEKYMGLLDAMDRCSSGNSEIIAFHLDGAISLQELKRQADYWQSVASEG